MIGRFRVISIHIAYILLAVIVLSNLPVTYTSSIHVEYEKLGYRILYDTPGMPIRELDEFNMYVFSVSSLLDKPSIINIILRIILANGSKHVGIEYFKEKYDCRTTIYRIDEISEKYLVCKARDITLAIGEYGHVLFNIYDGFSLPYMYLDKGVLKDVYDIYGWLRDQGINVSLKYLGQESGGYSIVKVIGNTTASLPIKEGVYQLNPRDIYGIYLDGILIYPAIAIRGNVKGSWPVGELNYSLQYLRGFFPVIEKVYPIKYNVSEEVYRIASEYWSREYGKSLDIDDLVVLDLYYTLNPFSWKLVPRLRIGVNGTNKILGIDLEEDGPILIVEEVVSGIVGVNNLAADYNFYIEGYPPIDRLFNPSTGENNALNGNLNTTELLLYSTILALAIAVAVLIMYIKKLKK